MKDHQWELATERETVFTFGTLDTGIQTTHAPDLGQRDVDTQDVPLPREDGDAFGVDYEKGTTISFECNVLSEDWQGNSDLLNQFRAAWSSRAFRDKPSAYAVLRVQNAGRVRRCYGRPRRFAEADSDLTRDGYTGVVCDFTTRDGKFYAEEISVATVPIVPPESIGFTTPIVVTGTDPNTVAFQTETLDPSQQPGNVTVQTETWPWVEIHGPVVSPSVQLGDLKIALDGVVISVGESILLDPRPWLRRVQRTSDKANYAGRLTWDTPPMGEWLLVPGSYELVYRGDDATGTSFATVSWREAFHRP